MIEIKDWDYDQDAISAAMDAAQAVFDNNGTAEAALVEAFSAARASESTGPVTEETVPDSKTESDKEILDDIRKDLESSEIDQEVIEDALTAASAALALLGGTASSALAAAQAYVETPFSYI
jgi:hypothetical protein